MFPLSMSFFGGEPLFQMLLIAAAILTGIYNALWKEPVTVLGGKRLIFLRSLFVLFLVVPYAIQSGFSSFNIEPSFESASFLSLIAIFFLAYPGLYFFVKATKSGPTTVVVPVASSFTILLPVLVHVFLFKDWDFHHFSVAGFLLLILGLLLLKFRLSAGRIIYTGDAGFWYAFLSAILMGIVVAMSEWIIPAVGTAVTLIVQEGSVLILSLVHILFSRLIGIRKKQKGNQVAFRWSSTQLKHHWRTYAWIIGLIGVLSGLAEVFRMISQNAPQPMATFFMSFSALVSVIVAQLYYSEKLRPQQWLAVFFLIAGIFIVSWIGDGQLRNSHFFLTD